MKETLAEKNLRGIVGNKVWKEMSVEGRQKLVKKFEIESDKETRSISGTINVLRNYSFNLGLLTMGISLGMIGSFLVNAVDRLELLYFGQDSYGYNIGVIIVCLVALYAVFRQFNGLIKSILLSNKDIVSYFEKESVDH